MQGISLLEFLLLCSGEDMCEIWEEVRNEGINKGKIEVAQELIKNGKLSIEEIAKCSGMSIETVRELAGNKTA